jgi:hypothetical protein
MSQNAQHTLPNRIMLRSRSLYPGQAILYTIAHNILHRLATVFLMGPFAAVKTRQLQTSVKEKLIYCDKVPSAPPHLSLRMAVTNATSRAAGDFSGEIYLG